MADLEQLNVRLTASTGEAHKAINKLIEDFGKLNMALNNFGADSDYIKGLDNLVGGLERLGEAVSSINPEQIKDISSALGSLAKNGDKLAQLSGRTFLTGVASESQKLAVASDNARKKAEELANSYNFDTKGEGVNKLAMAIDKLQASAGDEQAIRDTKNEIEEIIKAYARYENELHGTTKAENELIRNSHKKLNNDWMEQFGDSESAKSARAKAGISTSSKQGGSAASIVTENAVLGMQELANESDNLGQVLNRLRDNEYDAKNEFVGFSEVSEYVSGGIQQVRADIDELCSSLGIVTDKMKDMQETAGSDDFMDMSGIDLDAEPWMQGDTASKVEEIAKAEEHAASAGQKMSESVQNIGQAGTLFTPLAQGLTEIANVVMPDMTPLMQLKDAISKIGGASGQNAASSLPLIAQGLKSLQGSVPEFGTSLNDLAAGLRALGSPTIVRAGESMPIVAAGLRELEGIKVTADVDKIANLAHAISRFGLANIEKSIANMPYLADALKQLINTLSQVPAVSDNTIMLINALSKLNVSGSGLERTFNGTSNGLRRYSSAARNARKHTASLASIAGKMYANFFLLFRLFRKAGESIDLASQLKEVQNVVDVTFGDMSEKMNSFAKEAVDAVGMSELTAKKIGSRYQAMGTAMSISPKMIKDASEFVNVATNGYAEVSDSMSDMSLNLTKLAGDMASFYNVGYEDVAEKMNAIFTGQTRPLRVFGLDLTQATLQEWALAHGMDVDIKKMTQAEKTMLRYQYVLANTTAAQGDFQRTITTWANQTRIAQERIKQLMIVLGQIGIYSFKPLVMNFNNAMNTIIDLATSTLNSLGKIFGWQVEWSNAGILHDESEGLEDVADGYDDASKSAKKFKNFLLGIDELNLLPDDKDGKGGGADDLAEAYGDLGAMAGNLNIKEIDSAFDSLYDTLYKLGKRIGEVEKEWLQSFDWDDIFRKARNFGENIADFLNGYLSDSELFYEKGKFIANGINTIANAIDAFFKRFDGWKLGVDIGSAINGFTENLDWDVIRSAAYEMAHDIAMTINGALLTTKWDMVGSTIANGFNTAVDFLYTLGDDIDWVLVGTSIANGVNGLFETFDFSKLASTINKWAEGILDAVLTALKKTDWEMVGRKIGDFLSGLDIMEIASKVGAVIWEAINAGVELWYGMFDNAPIETAIITALAMPFSNKVFNSKFRGIIGRFSQYVGTAIGSDLLDVFNGNVGRTFANGYRSYFGQFDSIEMNGTLFGGIKEGFNSVSKMLSTPTKIVGGLGTVAAEFALVSDATSDWVKGVDGVVSSIGQIATAVGIATPVLAGLFGIPAGLIVAGAGAAAGAVKGVYDGLEEIERNEAIAILSRNIGDANITLEELTGSYKSIVDNMTGELDRMNREADRLSNLKSNLNDALEGFKNIKFAAENGQMLTSGALSDLCDDIGAVKQAWEDYVKAQYDWMITATMNNMQFAASQGELTDAEKKYYTDRIKELYGMKEAAVNGVSEVTQAVEEKYAAWKEALEHPPMDDYRGYGIPTYTQELEKELENAIIDMVNFGTEAGVLMDEEAAKFEENARKMIETAEGIDFSNIDPSNYENYANSLIAANDSIESSFNQAETSIKTFADNMRSNGFGEEEVTLQLRPRVEVQTDYAERSVEVMQKGLFDKFYSILSTSNADDAREYAEKVIKPYLASFPEVFDEEGKKIEPVLQQAIDELFDNAYGTDSGVNYSSIREKYFGIGSELGDATTEGFLATAGAASVVEDAFGNMGKTSASAFGNIDRSMKPAITKADLFRRNMLLMNDEFDKASLKSDRMKGSFDSLSTTFDTVKDKLNKSKSFDGVKQSTDEVVGGLDSIKDKTATTANVLQTNLSVMGGYIKTAFEGITSTKNIFVQGFEEDITRLFSAQTWETMITGVPNAFRSMWESTMNVMKNMWNDFSKWVNQNAVIEIPKTKVGNTEIGGLNIKMRIPKYETGGFPEDGFFYANHTEMVGSFSNGKTAVANNEQITEGIERAVYRAMTDAMAQGGGSVNVELQGDAASIFTAVVKENNNHIMRTGYSPIRN